MSVDFNAEFETFVSSIACLDRCLLAILQSPDKAEPKKHTSNDQKAVSSNSSLAKPTSSWVKPAAYGLLNIASATGIVFANKAVLSVYGFEFATALTLLHTLTTVVGMMLFCQLGMFTPKQVPILQVSAVAPVCYLLLLTCTNIMHIWIAAVLLLYLNIDLSVTYSIVWLHLPCITPWLLALH